MSDYQATDREALRDRIQDRRDDVFWTDTEVNWAIDEALKVWMVLTLYLRSTQTVIPGEVAFYEGHSVFNSLNFAILRMYQDDSTLDAEPLMTIDEANPDWQNEVASSAPSTWIPLGMVDFALSPPNSGTATQYRITVARSHHNQASPLDDTSFIQVAEEDIPALVDYATYVLLIKEGGQELQTAQKLIQRFLAHVIRYNSRVERFKSYRDIAAGRPALRVGPPTQQGDR